ncbi:MAG: Type II secretion system protein D [Gammaproteobacteria bacterium]|nr:Type II secretion system protein D [Gammaproteobacteria bacterium]
MRPVSREIHRAGIGRTIARTLLAVGLVALGVWARAAEPDLRGIDIRQYIEWVAARTGRSFVVDPRVQGKVDIVGEMPAEPGAFYRVFESVMRVQGYALIESGRVVKIVPQIVGRTLGQNDSSGRFGGEALVTKVIHLRYLTVAELVPVLQPLVPPEAYMNRDVGSNTLVIADTRANVERIAFIIDAIDQPPDRVVEIAPLQHARADDLARQLNEVVSRDMATMFKPAVPAIADARSNSVLINGSRGEIAFMRRLIADLDAAAPAAGGAAVVYLRHASAGDLVETLQGVEERLIGAQEDAPSGSAALVAAAVASLESGGEPPPPTAPAASAGSRAQSLSIAADARTNAIVMHGPPSRIEAMRAVIAALDVARAQVHVEALVAEVSATRAAEFGIQWRTDTPGTGALAGIILPGTEAGDIQDLTGEAAQLGTGLSLGFLDAGAARGLLRALATDGSSNVLATPSLATLDNEEAEILVGQNVPILIGQYTTTGSGDGVNNPFQTVERRDVGVRLKVKPQITRGELVRLTVEQELSAVAPGSVAADLILDKRAIRTDVVVQDGQTIVIGGLVSEDVRQGTQKVPVLGGLPVLGDAARDRRSDVTYANVLVFLRPTIIRDAARAAAVTDEAIIDLRSGHRTSSSPVTLLPGVSTPALPSMPSR